MANSTETAAHRELKRAALFWAQKEGFRSCAEEVILPHCRYRADLAAYRPRRQRREIHDPVSQSKRLKSCAAIGQTAVFECKQARPDLLKDSRRIRETLAELKTLHDRCRNLERQLLVHYPNLRNGDSLFQDYETGDLDNLSHESYREVRRRIRTLQSRIYDQTKFEKVIRYGCANLHYLVVREDLLRDYEAPSGWGVLAAEIPPDLDTASLDEPLPLRCLAKATFFTVGEDVRLELLQSIAAAGTRRRNAEAGISYELVLEARRKGE